MDQVRPLTSLSQDELIARIEQYIVVAELRDAEIRELYAVNSTLLAERDALREAAQAALIYDQAIQSCANDPNAMSSFCTAVGDDLDTLYEAWITKSRAALAQGQEEVK